MKVTVYSTPTCPYCKLVKKFLTAHDVAYSDVDVSADGDAAQMIVRKTGQMGVPVVEIDDDTMVGYDESQLKKMLGIK